MLTNASNSFRLPQAALDACAQEPIHIPGSIQPQGVLLIFSTVDLVIMQASANSAELLELDPAELLGLPLDSLLSAPVVAQVRQHLALAAEGRVAPVDIQLFIGSWPLPALGLVHQHGGLAFLEIIPLADDPLAPQGKELVRKTISDLTQAPYYELPLHAITQHPTLLSVNRAVDSSLQSFCQHVTDLVRALTAYDRVMIYQFDDVGNGEIVAEARDERLEPFLGLCYPAADIPSQARLLYLRSRVRALGDIYAQPALLVPSLNPLSGAAPDLSYCLLRSFSPVHLEYLRNMGVRATLTISIIEQGRLWGLIACHHDEPLWPTQSMRAACDLLSEVISMQIALRAQYLRSQALARAHALEHDLIRQLAGRSDWFTTLAEIAGELAAMLDADGVAICQGQRIVSVGSAPDREQIHALVTWLQTTVPARVLVTDTLTSLSSSFAALAPVASGLIAIEIARTSGSYLLWFRREMVQTVRWGGNPDEKLIVGEGVARLRPRSSFAAWITEMRGKARPWPSASLHLAEALRAVLVEVVLELLTTRHTLAALDLLRIRRAVEASGEPIAISGEEGDALFVNAAFTQLTGHNQASLQATGGLRALLADPIVAALIEEAGRSEAGFWQGEIELSTRGGEAIPVQLRVDGVRDEHGVMIGQLRLYSDLRPQRRVEEERRKLDRQLLQAQKLESLGVLAGGIAHDFNNLLTAVLGHANLALLDLPPDSAARESLAQIELAAQRAAELRRQMLDYSGRGHFVMQPVDLNQVVIEMTRLLQTVIVKTAVLKFNLGEQLPPVCADATQLRQIVMNLITNASDAIGARSGVITLTTGTLAVDAEYLHSLMTLEPLPDGIYVTLDVSDTGVGMDAATQQRIFEPFFTTKFTGRGLGLAAVQGIVRGHKGAIRVYSQPCSGTTFRIVLPISEQDQSYRQPPNALVPMGAGQTVLVIDDDESVRGLARRVLERGGFRVLIAENGRVGLDIALQQGDSISAVLLDLTMPEMSGMETFSALRQLRADLPVLLCSGYNEEEATAGFAGKGLAGFIPKPFRALDLLTAIHDILGRA